MHATISTKNGISNHRLALSVDLIEILAQKVTRNSSCKLNQVTIFINNARGIQHCRNRIVRCAKDNGCSATLGPIITTLPLWASQHPVSEGLQLVDPRLRELILVEALLDHRQLYKNASPWALANNLLLLFDQLSMQVDPISNDLTQFEEHISDSYGLKATSNRYLTDEANLVHQLWHAMQQQLSADHYVDHVSAYRQQLDSALKMVSEESIFYFAGFQQPTPIESRFINQLSKRCEVHNICFAIDSDFFQQVGNESRLKNNTLVTIDRQTSGNENFFDYIYSPDNQSLQRRREQCLRIFPHSPANTKIKIFCANDRENEALAIQRQIRLWLHGGKSNIGFITNNRKLARRVRALLERHNIDLKDESGWNLSTTSSAAVLEQWLQCIDQDFHYLPLLDLLKSPFIYPAEDRQKRLVTVYRFEKHIVLHENISENIERYTYATHNRQKRLPHHLSTHLSHIVPMLQRISDPALPFAKYKKGSYPPRIYLQLLWQSLQDLGILESFSGDAAGEHILDELQKLLRAAEASDIKISWTEFRAWLGHKLEHRQFQPGDTDAKVQIVSLQQSNLSSFDCIVIGAAEREYLPSNLAHSPFFNNAVRKNLGLTGSEEFKNSEFILFRHHLERACVQDTVHPHQPALLITHTRIINDEEIPPSPWLELLTTNHSYFYGHTLYASYLQDYIDHHLCQFDAQPIAKALPIAQTAVHTELLPDYFSASSYQQLLDCPYQYFVARCLKLEAPEEIRDYLQKSDYGELVHLILQAFHSDVAKLPGPFQYQVSNKNKQQAISLLIEISIAVFRKDIEDNFAHRAWLNQWLAIAPAYINWLIEYQLEWEIDRVESTIDKLEYRNNVRLSARLDRIDKNAHKLSIIDYKTGLIRSKEKVLNGEAVQLPFYALTSSCEAENDLQNNKVEQIAYLSLGSDGVRMKNVIAGDELSELQRQTGARLVTMANQLRAGTELIAWGDEEVCDYCTMKGICRRQYRGPG